MMKVEMDSMGQENQIILLIENRLLILQFHYQAPQQFNFHQVFFNLDIMILFPLVFGLHMRHLVMLESFLQKTQKVIFVLQEEMETELI